MKPLGADWQGLEGAFLTLELPLGHIPINFEWFWSCHSCSPPGLGLRLELWVVIQIQAQRQRAGLELARDEEEMEGWSSGQTTHRYHPAEHGCAQA
jgi:hypothetical protein